MSTEMKFDNDAFWETSQKEILNCISIQQENNKEIRKVWKTKKGEDIFEAAVKFLGEEHIDKNTEARVKRKYDRQQAKKEAINAQKKAQQLEKLFNHKLEVFEIEEIKKSKNRKLKAKIRRSKSIPEVNIYAMLIMKEELDIEGE
mgnify:FL=1